ncbi:MAG: hypothetical protein FJ335_01045 [Sphingomonadales bacterium]|nr:hypothetical protein [Sphingomonadales bacterium]MBN2970524.1 hypothetical protein [Roseomonas aeriglobus]
MLPMLTLLLAIGFVGIALYRFSPSAPPRLKNAQLAAALASGLLGIATFKMLGDSRWLVGGILLFGAGVPGFLAGNRKTLRTVALICGLLGLALYGIATSRPMMPVVVAN